MIMDISSLGDGEYVLLAGHYNKLRRRDQIDPRLLEKGYSEEAIRQLQKRVGTSTDFIVSANLRLQGNLARFEYPYFNFVMALFDKYNRFGVLPYPGSMADQPAKILEIFDLLAQLQYEAEEEARKEHERKAKQDGRRSNKR